MGRSVPIWTIRDRTRSEAAGLLALVLAVVAGPPDLARLAVGQGPEPVRASAPAPGPGAAAASAEGLPRPDGVARIVLAAADDGTDRLGEPVAVMLEHARRVAAGAAGSAGERVDEDSATGGVGGVEAGGASASIGPERPVPLDPRVLETPDAFRGRATVVAGRLEQAAPRPAAGPGVEEWFVRDASGAVAVLVPDGPAVPPGRRVRVEGWFVRVLAAEARDGTRRRYPLVVAAPHRIAVEGVARDSGLGTRIGLLTGLLVLAAGVMLVARRLARPRRGAGGAAPAAVLAVRRERRDRRHRSPGAGSPGGGAAPHAEPRPASLPADPAAALARLRAEAAADDAEPPPEPSGLGRGADEADQGDGPAEADGPDGSASR